jgi:hypothetical protein
VRISAKIVFIFVTMATAASACTSVQSTQGSPAKTAEVPPSATSKASADVPSSAVPTVSGSPISKEAETVPDAKTLAYQPPTTGSSIVDRVDARAGAPLWVNVTCHDATDSSIEVEFKPLDRFTVECTAQGFATRNQINLTQPRQLTISVKSDTDATWSLRVQQ